MRNGNTADDREWSSTGKVLILPMRNGNPEWPSKQDANNEFLSYL